MSSTPDDPFARGSNDDGTMPPPPPPSQPEYAQPQYAQPQYAQPQYGQPQYGQQQQYAYPQPYAAPNPAQAKNWMGIVALVASLSTIITGIGCIIGIVFGHLALSAIKKGEADNRGLALGGLITGYVLLGLGLLAVIGYFVFLVVVIGTTSTY